MSQTRRQDSGTTIPGSPIERRIESQLSQVAEKKVRAAEADSLRKRFFLYGGIAERRRSFRFQTVRPESKSSRGMWQESAFPPITLGQHQKISFRKTFLFVSGSILFFITSRMIPFDRGIK